MRENKLLLFLFLFFLDATLGAQDSKVDSLNRGEKRLERGNIIGERNLLVDSLTLVLETLGENTSRVNTLNAIADALHRPDPNGAIRYGTEAKILALHLNDRQGLANAYRNIGLGYYLQGEYAEAFRNWEPALEIFEELGDDRMIANIKQNLGAIYYTTGHLKEALENYLPALKLAERLGDSIRIGTLLMNIGVVYAELPGSQDTARKYYQRAIKMGEALDRNDISGVTLLNLGEIYIDMGEYDSAKYYLEKSLTIPSSSSDISVALSYMGKIYYNKGDFRQAIETYQDALKEAERENSQKEIVDIKLGLAATYGNLDDPGRAIDYYKEAEAIAEEIGLQQQRSIAYEGLATNYARLFDYQNAYKYLSLQNTIDNAYYRMQSDDDANNLLFNYQLEKKQDEIALLEQKSKIEQLMNKRQKAISIAVSILGLFILAVAGGLYSRMRYIRKTSRQINEQKQQITDSITYAQRIQSAILPSEELMSELLPEHFILFRPKDIVSGDFYWIKEVQDHLVIVEADCTGHGVPGAFMSVLGITLFHDLVGERCFDAPGAILDSLREKLTSILVQQDKGNDQKEGMDIAITVYNKNNRELHFAGANNPLYIVRRNHSEDRELAPFASVDNGEYRLFEIKGDKQPIGRYWEEKPFRTTSVYLREHDSFYIFSDGYIDQFGGEPRKKFKSLNFKKLLLSVQDQPMEIQKRTLERTFDEWKGPNEQIDDISVLGIRV